MKALLPILAVSFGLILGFGIHAKADGTTGFSLIIQNGGTPQGAVVILNCDGTTTTCTTKSGVATLSASGAGGGITQLTGDVTAGPGSGSQAASVVKVNGLAVPASASVTGTNSSSQFVSQTAATVTAFLNQFTSLLQGVVPASGGGTINFLRADGTWAAPGGGGSVNVPSLVQATGARGNPVTSLAYPINVTSGDVLVVPMTWFTGSTNATIADTLTTSWTAKVTLNVSGGQNCTVYTGTPGSSGADTVTVTLPGGAGFNAIYVTEWRNLKATADGTATGSTNSVLSLTTAVAGDLVMALIDGSSSGGTTIPLLGWEYPMIISGNDSGALQWYVQPAAGTINTGMSNNSGAVGLCALALEHS